jgi:hypothetical protein
MASTKNIVQKGWVYFMVDEPWLMIIARTIFQGAFKVKIGYTTSLLDRRGQHQTGNSRRIWDIIRPLKFRRASAAKKFETVCHRIVGQASRVHEAGNGQEWYWCSWLMLFRLQVIHGKMHRRSGPLLIAFIAAFFRFVRRILAFMINIPLWFIVFVLLGIKNALHFGGMLSDFIYKPFQPYNRKFLQWVAGESKKENSGLCVQASRVCTA